MTTNKPDEVHSLLVECERALCCPDPAQRQVTASKVLRMLAAYTAPAVPLQTTNFIASNGEYRNPSYQGQHDGETLEQSAYRLHWVTAAIETERANTAPQPADQQPAPNAALLEAFDAGRRAAQAEAAELVTALEDINQWVNRWVSADHPVAKAARKALAAYRNQGGDT